MEGRREGVVTSPSPFSSAVSPPCQVDGLSQIWSLPGICYGAKMDGPQSYVPRHSCQFGLSSRFKDAAKHLMFAVSLNRFLWPPRVLLPCVVQTVLVGETIV